MLSFFNENVSEKADCKMKPSAINLTITLSTISFSGTLVELEVHANETKLQEKKIKNGLNAVETFSDKQMSPAEPWNHLVHASVQFHLQF